MEVEVIWQVLVKDGTVVVIDACESLKFWAGSIPGACNILCSLVLCTVLMWISGCSGGL